MKIHSTTYPPTGETIRQVTFQLPCCGGRWRFLVDPRWQEPRHKVIECKDCGERYIVEYREQGVTAVYRAAGKALVERLQDEVEEYHKLVERLVTSVEGDSLFGYAVAQEIYDARAKLLERSQS